jgi:hypothetical protein
MINEHDLVVLTRSLPEHELEAGDVGVAVMVHPGGGYEVEFVSASGRALAVLTLGASDLRPMSGTEILHVRDLEAV